MNDATRARLDTLLELHSELTRAAYYNVVGADAQGIMLYAAQIVFNKLKGEFTHDDDRGADLAAVETDDPRFAHLIAEEVKDLESLGRRALVERRNWAEVHSPGDVSAINAALADLDEADTRRRVWDKAVTESAPIDDPDEILQHAERGVAAQHAQHEVVVRIPKEWPAAEMAGFVQRAEDDAMARADIGGPSGIVWWEDSTKTWMLRVDGDGAETIKFPFAFETLRASDSKPDPDGIPATITMADLRDIEEELRTGPGPKASALIKVRALQRRLIERPVLYALKLTLDKSSRETLDEFDPDIRPSD